MKLLHYIKPLLLRTLMASTVFFGALANTAFAQAPNLSDVSLLPETIASGLAVRPNILLIFDTSEAMARDINGAPLVGGASDPLSKSSIARATLLSAMDTYEGEVNIGLMTFDAPAADLTTGEGLLQAAIKSYSGAHRDNIRAKLGLSGAPGALADEGGIPTEGALRDAKDYLDGSLRPLQNLTGEVLADTYLTPQACEAPIYVVLVTAGAPNRSPGNAGADAHGNDCTNIDDTFCAADAAAALESGANEIKTYVIGFDSMLINELDSIANSGGSQAMYTMDATGLESAFDSVLSEIYVGLEVGSASGISVIASSSTGKGSFVQAIFNSVLDDSATGERIYWTGDLSAYFIDSFGFFREDTNGNAILDTTDRAFRSEFDDATNEVVVTTFDVSLAGTPSFVEGASPATTDLDGLNPIWSAADELNNYPQSVAGVDVFTKQRTYESAANPLSSDGNRYIFTWLQTDPTDENYHLGRELEFTYDGADDLADPSNINQDNFGLIAGTAPDAVNIINFIRGQEGISGKRSRTLGASSDRYILGDMVHSTAVQIDAPTEFYDVVYDVASYGEFREQYQNRRRMVYAGGNDGLLHAFNGGFYNDLTDTFSKTSADDTVAHELGAEIWAYAPMNLLPHLHFITDPGYDSSSHVAYVDGPVQTFDVKIFDDDDVHPGGWGTILVAGMRFGGTPYPGVEYSQASGATFTASSAYIILDVTDPRIPPTVLGEISPPKLGYTTSTPDVMNVGIVGDEWYLMLGSGPTELATATSNQVARIYRYKLNREMGETPSLDTSFDGLANNGKVGGPANGFVGDIVAHDWSNNFTDDVAYFGTVTGTEAAAGGGLHRYVTDSTGTTSGSLNDLLDTGKPMLTAPTVKTFADEDWVFAGSGRYLTGKDAENTETNTIYGLIEEFYPTIVDSTLVDVTDVVVNINPSTGAETLSPAPATEIDTYSELRAYILDGANNKSGWKSDIQRNPVNNAFPSAKHTASPLSFKNLLFYTSYDPPMPDNNLCLNEFGDSFLSVVDLVTGTTIAIEGFTGPLGQETNGDFVKTTKLGSGYAYQPYLFIGPDPVTGEARVSVKSPSGTGVIDEQTVLIAPTISGRTSWQELEVQ